MSETRMRPAGNNQHPPPSPEGPLHGLPIPVPLQPQASLRNVPWDQQLEDIETTQDNARIEEDLDEDDDNRPDGQGSIDLSRSPHTSALNTEVKPSTQLDLLDPPHPISEEVPNTGESLKQQHTLTAATSETLSTSPPEPALSGSTHTAAHRGPISYKESIGLGGLISLIGGSFGILGTLGFIAFLWFGYGPTPEAANATWVWRQLALRGWMSRAITLSSLALQLIIDAQVIICTSMIAALLLERCSIRRLDVARISVMRGTDSSALKLAQLVLFSKRWAVFSHIETWLVLLLGLLGLALQFTSTILLSDLRPYVMAGDLNSSRVDSLFSYPGKNNFSLFQGSLISNAPTYSVFSEVATGYDTSPDSAGFSDTGLKQRGLLPLVGSQNRTSVRQYSGNAMVLSSRIACMRPAVLSGQYSTTEGEGMFGTLAGILDYSQALHEANPGANISCPSSEDCERMPFSCMIPAADKTTNDTWASMACVAGGIGPAGFRGPYAPSWDSAENPWSANSSVWLVGSTNLQSDQWSSLDTDGALPPGQPLENAEWLTYEMLPGYYINISMCFTAFSIEHHQVQMVAPGNTREPSAHWSLMYDAANTDDIQVYIGVHSEHHDLADRGILELHFPDDGNNSTAAGLPPPLHDVLELPGDEITPSDLTAGSLQLEMEYEFSGGNTPNTTFTLCHWCTTDSAQVHPEYALLFAGILAASPGGGRAADALDAFLNIGSFSAYNQFLLDSMDVAEDVAMITAFAVTTPGPCSSAGMCAGFISVTTLLASYLALVGAVVVIFVRCTRYSRCGNVWNTISQLVGSEELAELLDLGVDAGDSAIAKHVQHVEPGGDILVKLDRSKPSGKLGIVRCEGTYKTETP